MSDYIRLPRSALDIIGDKDLWQLYGYLLSKADENGIVNTTLATMQRDLKVNQKPLRTMLERLEKANLGAKEKASKKTSKFTPPTDEEVAAYITEKGYHFNPAEFVPHYEARNWMMGKTPMKNWKAACRYWETTWKQKYGEKYFYEIHPSTAKDKYSARRGTDVGNLSESDYGGPF